MTKDITIHLTFNHSIGANIYGPGVTVIPGKDAAIASLLIEQDQKARARELDETTPRSPRSYVIAGSSWQNNTLVRVSDNFFNDNTYINDQRFIRTIT